MDIGISQIEQEFPQTFGYIRQDIAAILKTDLHLNYTIALLGCCACEMLTWYRGLPDSEAHRVFTSLLPKAEPYGVVGKTLWEALRNGLAHSFRPNTIEIGGDKWRFRLSSDGRLPYIRVESLEGYYWLTFNIRTFSERVIAEINEYEHQLRRDPDARLGFREKTKAYTKLIRPDATKIAEALKAIIENPR